MKAILILYATSEGQTRRIAGHLSSTLLAHGRAVVCQDVKQPSVPLNFDDYDGCILAASIHRGRHDKAMVRFVRDHKAQLEALPSAFVSVSLTETTAEDPRQSPEERARASAIVDQLIEGFFAETAWHPDRVQAVAGALMYTQYGWLTRYVMKSIAGKAGGATDTSRNHQYTDWVALEHFALDFDAALRASGPGRLARDPGTQRKWMSA